MNTASTLLRVSNRISAHAGTAVKLFMLFGLVLLLAACEGNAPSVNPPLSAPTPRPSATPLPNIATPESTPQIMPELVPTSEPPIVGDLPDDLLGKIMSDLEKRTGVERQAIQVVRAEATVWNDGSLGCPKPGEFYQQVLVDGFWVVLQTGSTEYDYRASAKGYYFLCEKPGAREIGTPQKIIVP
jgi:hypothetical protein